MSVLKNFEMKMLPFEPTKEESDEDEDDYKRTPSTRQMKMLKVRRPMPLMKQGQTRLRFQEDPPEDPYKLRLDEIAMMPGKHGDKYVQLPDPPKPPPIITHEEEIDKLVEEVTKDKNGKSYPGYKKKRKETELKEKYESHLKLEEEERKINNLNWYNTANFENFKSKIGDASIRGLQNGDRGERYDEREDDPNHRSYYSTNLMDQFKDAKYKYTLSTHPQGVLKVVNINHIPVENPVAYHLPSNERPITNSLMNSRVSIARTFREYQAKKVQDMYGAPIPFEEDTRFVDPRSKGRE